MAKMAMRRLPKLFLQFTLISICLLYKPSGCSSPPICEEKKTCNDCIGVYGCTWCKELKEPYLQYKRCSTLQAHKTNKCPASSIVEAEPSQFKIIKHEPISKSMRIAPQQVSVKLAVGQGIDIELGYNDSSHKALDLYYIMDLSATMEDDKATVSTQAHNLVGELKKITEDVRLGFGAFIDKPVLPYVSSSQLRPDNKYDMPYGFKNWLSLTDDIGKFTEVVANAKLSRNLDEPEGTLDALMQAITCKEEINWRNTSRKLIVVATDGPFHIAGDGKLGGIIRPNDLKCHMENHVYTHSTLIDYPSIGEINAVILEHKVYVIFAVSKDQGNDIFQVYDELQNYITQSTTEQLNVDSSNVVQKIKAKYLEISQTVKLTVEEAPSFVSVSVSAKCPSKKGHERQDYCTDVGVGKKIDFKINIKLKECPDPRRHPNIKGGNRVVISFFELTGKEKLIIDLSYACDCECNKEKIESPNTLTRYCSGEVASTHASCGLCICKDDRYGESCQCSRTNDQGNRTNCIPPGKEAVECSNNGECKCGQCECPRDFNGKYCEDSTLDCQNQNSQFPERICSDNGQCIKGKCECSEKYEGKFCECETSRKVSCVEPGKSIDNICNGHGTCLCTGSQAQCKCDSDYTGVYCGVCKINCPASGGQLRSRCQEKIIQQCVRCQIRKYHSEIKDEQECIQECDWKGALEKRNDNEMGKRSDVGIYEFKPLSSAESLSDVIGTECQVSINSSCTSTFKYTYQRASQNDVLQVYYSPLKVDCTVEPPVIWYIFGVILTVLLAGILGLLIWKLAIHLHDTREYQKFKKETSQAKWHGGENPLFIKPMAEFENPAYSS